MKNDATSLSAISIEGDLSGVGYETSLPLVSLEDTDSSKVWIRKNLEDWKAHGTTRHCNDLVSRSWDFLLPSIQCLVFLYSY